MKRDLSLLWQWLEWRLKKGSATHGDLVFDMFEKFGTQFTMKDLEKILKEAVNPRTNKTNILISKDKRTGRYSNLEGLSKVFL